MRRVLRSESAGTNQRTPLRMSASTKLNSAEQSQPEVGAETPNDTPISTNATSYGLSQELREMLTQVSLQLRKVAARMAQDLEGQISTPEYADSGDVAAERLIDWTADVFAISEDIEFYINPPRGENKE